jgi:hypothetical protein
VQITFKIKPGVKGDHKALLRIEEFIANETDLTSLTKDIPLNITGAPLRYELVQNYPNPFNATTKIRYQIADDNIHVMLEIFDITGRVVAKLVDRAQEAGVYEVTWDGTNMNGTGVSSGIYFYRLRTEKFTSMKKFHLLK